MPRKYIRKKNTVGRRPVSPNRIKSAVEYILTGASIKYAAKHFNLNIMTLKRYYRRQLEQGVDSISYQPDFGKSTRVFTTQEETMLVEYIVKASKLHFGLTAKCARSLAYEFAIQNGKKIPQNWERNKIASYDWLNAFMRRNQQISIRVPEPTSMSRATSFNQHNFSMFMNNLASLQERFSFGPESMWNIDETGLTTVQTPRKIIATKGIC